MSYRRDDAAYPAHQLYDLLVEALGGEHVFIDSFSIDYGRDFEEVLREVLARVDVFLCVIGRAWSDIRAADGGRRLDDPGDYVRLELATALARDIRVIPVLVDGARMPSESELPADLVELSKRQAVEVSAKSFADDLKRLVESLGGVLAKAQPPRSLSSRLKPVLVQLAIAFAASLAVWVFFHSQQMPLGAMESVLVLAFWAAVVAVAGWAWRRARAWLGRRAARRTR